MKALIAASKSFRASCDTSHSRSFRSERVDPLEKFATWGRFSREIFCVDKNLNDSESHVIRARGSILIVIQ